VDWFEKLTGFPETDYHSTRAKLAVEGHQLRLSSMARVMGSASLKWFRLNPCTKG
jgi:hypothetical protein